MNVGGSRRCVGPIRSSVAHSELHHGEAYSPTGQPIGQETKMDIIRIIIAILLPPLGVFLQVGIGKHFWINILLTLLGYIPGIVHAVWVIAKY
jgi:uncharacterized membrane protein YqaE (UPF0057 family)